MEQGKEPPCFLSLFSGNMVTHLGKREEEDGATSTPQRHSKHHRLYLLQHELEFETNLLEVPCHSSSLRSRGTFLLVNTMHASAFIWHGAKTAPHYKKRASELITRLKSHCPPEMGVAKAGLKVVVEVEEGREKGEFWEAVGGGKSPREAMKLYHSLAKVRAPCDNTPRLFKMTSVSGEFLALEVLNSTRNTLNVPCAFPVLQSELYNASQPGNNTSRDHFSRFLKLQPYLTS